MKFDYPLELGDDVIQKLNKSGIETPFPIQKEAAQAVYDGESARIKAPTGSGKTLSYLLPLGKAMQDNFRMNLIVLSSSPELSSQIHSVFKEYFPEFSSALIVGGANLRRQKEKLKTRPKAIFATPGRLFELFCLERVSIGDNTALVMDESDTLLDGINFEKVFSLAEGAGQLITASATFNEDSEAFLKDLPHEIKNIEVSKREGTVHHSYVFCSDDKKEFSLIKLLRNKDFGKLLVFVNDIRHVKHLHQLISKEGFKVVKLDSKSSKNDREKAIKALKAEEVKVMIATDSLARGIDVKSLSVIQYSIAREEDIFVHRSGRVGRAGSEGWNISLVSKKDSFVLFKYAKSLKLDLKEFSLGQKKKQVVKEKSLDEKPKKKRKKNRVNKNKGMRRKKM